MRAGPAGAAVPALVLAVLAAWPLRRALFGGEALYYRDLHLFWHPHMEAFVQAVAGGAAPLWNPLPNFGQPMLAYPDAQVAYPLTWLNLLMPAWSFYTVFALVHTAGSAIGMFLLARHWRLSKPAALAAAALWLLSGPMVSLTSLWHHFASACWSPWVFLTADRTLLRPRARRIAAWGCVAALQMLAGSADLVAMTWLGFAAYAAAYRFRWRRGRRRANLPRVASAAAATLLAVGLSAVQWAPSVDVLRRSHRLEFDETVRTYWSVHPASLTQAFVPWHWEAMPIHPYARRLLFESREPFLASLYLGIGTLPLAGAALACRGRRAAFPAAVALGSALVALGRHAPFYSILVTLAPPLSILRYPVKVWIPLAFAWAFLCALGVEAWRARGAVGLRAWRAGVLGPMTVAAACAAGLAVALRLAPDLPRDLLLHPRTSPAEAAAALATLRWRVDGAALAAVAGAVLALLRQAAGPRRARELAAAAAALAVADLAVMHAEAVPTAPRLLYARPPVVDVLRQLGVRRLYSYDYYSSFRGHFLLDPTSSPRLLNVPPGFSRQAAGALAQQLHLAPSIAGRWRIPTGFEKDHYGLYTPGLNALRDRLIRTEGTPAHLRLLRMAGITHALAIHEGLRDLGLRALVPSAYERPVRVLEVPDPLPRAYAVGAARRATTEEALDLMAGGAFDPSREVILAADGQGAVVAGAPGPAGEARVVDERADAVRVKVTMASEGYLVLLDGYDPGWRVAVDGRRQDLLRANIAFRAVRLGPGDHEVVMRYRPASVMAGLGITLASAAAALALGGRLLGRRRSPC